jgi:hypothetical protein
MTATILAAVYDRWGRTVLIPAADVRPDHDRPASSARRPASEGARS